MTRGRNLPVAGLVVIVALILGEGAYPLVSQVGHFLGLIVRGIVWHLQHDTGKTLMEGAAGVSFAAFKEHLLAKELRFLELVLQTTGGEEGRVILLEQADGNIDNSPLEWTPRAPTGPTTQVAFEAWTGESIAFTGDDWRAIEQYTDQDTFMKALMDFFDGHDLGDEEGTYRYERLLLRARAHEEEDALRRR